MRDHSRLAARTGLCMLFKPDGRLAGNGDGNRRHRSSVAMVVVEGSSVRREVARCELTFPSFVM